MQTTAEEILRQANRINEQVDKFDGVINDVENDLSAISDIIKSEDSDLAASIYSVAQTLVRFQSRIRKNFTDLAAQMNTYGRATIANEEATSNEAKTIDSELNDINSVLVDVSNSTGSLDSDNAADAANFAD